LAGSRDLKIGGYTKEEQKLLDTKKREAGDRPTYYDADTESHIEITGTFENFLILASKEFKEKALQWVNETTKKEADSGLKDELLSLAIEKDVEYITSIYNEVSDKVRKYIDFKKTMKDLKDANAQEVGIMLDSLQAGMEEILYYFDKYEFLQKLLTAITQRSEEIINPEKLKERQSWANPILEYS
jgi:hypothetical protein